MDYSINIKLGVNYCCNSKGQIGFRGAADNWARLIPLPEDSAHSEEMFFFHGVDVPADMLPYLPDMGPDSAFKAHGYWHYYKIVWGIFIVYLTPNEADSCFNMRWILQAILFEGEEKPRVFLDERDSLIKEGVINFQEVQDILAILARKNIVI